MKLSPERNVMSNNHNNEYNDSLIEEEEGNNDHNVIVIGADLNHPAQPSLWLHIPFLESITTLFATNFFEIKVIKEIEPALKRGIDGGFGLFVIGRDKWLR
ncbi:hypothetical protein ACH5RR_008655 [Cinchona calisaya]|uniref:Uncharacterized protein n=1 Tax=Cinchona calisaya TaxID=153742 RepID=A0ABD3ACP1_9GENT